MTELAREYGEGLYELAREENLREEFNGALREIAGLFMQQPDYLRLLGSRAIALEERLKVVSDTFDGQVHPYLVNFMKLLVQRGKMDAFCDCAKWFFSRYNDDFGIVEAYVTTAVELSEAQMSALKTKLDEMTGKNVAIVSRVDPALLGGVRVEMNGQKFDNSIQNRLERLKHSLTTSI